MGGRSDSSGKERHWVLCPQRRSGWNHSQVIKSTILVDPERLLTHIFGNSQERKRQDAKELASQALGDLDTLMDRAREAVMITATALLQL